MASTSVSPARRRFYIVFGLLLAVWTAGLTVIAVTVIPDLYWFSYYAVDYRLGFVRRGLAGELVGLFSDEHYFRGLRILRWLPTIVYAAGLAALSYLVATGSGRSERRLMMALLIPVLPFGFTFALFSARPDLLGAVALIALAATLKHARSTRTIVLASAGYGAATALIALAHEATPLLFGLGAIVALAVLARHHPERTLRLCGALALIPGLLASLAIAAFSRRGISDQLCQSIPHGPVNWPASGRPTIGQVLGGFRFEVDYQGWICRNMLPLYDQGFGDAARFVADIGPVLLAASTAIGIALFATAILSISHVSGVPFSRMAALLRTRVLWVLFGLALVVPIFMTGVDWIRWWVTISLDIGIVFLLYASGQPESDQPPTRRTLVVFAVGSALLALFPIGILPGFGAPVPV